MMLPTLPNDARDGESHIRSVSMFRAMGRNQTSERKAMAKKTGGQKASAGEEYPAFSLLPYPLRHLLT
jgi:hypothetical protein